MKYKYKKKEQLLTDLRELHQQLSELIKIETESLLSS